MTDQSNLPGVLVCTRPGGCLGEPCRCTTIVCTYCKAPCAGDLRDSYGELMLNRPIPVCVECDEDFQEEDGPWVR